MSVHDRWNGARTGDGKRWEVRWRDGTRQRKRRFTTRQAADAWNAKITLTPDEGRAKPTVGDLHADWLATKTGLAQTTIAGYESAWKNHVQPRWGSVPVDRVTAGDVQSWVGGLQAHSRAGARTALSVLSGIMRHATMQGLVGANPCSGVRWPTIPRAEVQPLTVDEIGKLAAELVPHDLVVWTLATTGLRFGELAGLRVRDLDVKAGRLVVARSITTVDGRLVESLPKSGERRVVPVPAWLVQRIGQQVKGRGKDAPLFPTGSGGVWRKTSWRRLWVGEPHRGTEGALARAGLPASVRVHDLRHTAAVTMLEAGVPARTVQAVLGHASLTMTLDLYGRWVQPDLDAAAAVWADPERL